MRLGEMQAGDTFVGLLPETQTVTVCVTLSVEHVENLVRYQWWDLEDGELTMLVDSEDDIVDEIWSVFRGNACIKEPT
jgi:hypothetical protein